MKPNSERLAEIFAQAAKQDSPAEREEFLAAACAGDTELRQQLDTLLRAHDQAGDFLRQTVEVKDVDVIGEKPGSVIGRYKLLEQIGEGGFGVVYMAEQTEPVQRKVALKIIKAGMDTREVVARFEAERQALALMDHPNIAKILDAGVTGPAESQISDLKSQIHGGRPYFVMELVRGIPITSYCDRANLPTHERLQLFMKVCHAVQHAHQKGIIHRDVKPNNVLVTMHDGEPVPKVIDFGVAKALGQKLTEKTLFTGFAQMIGTPTYMSPEQAEMSGLDVDTRADIYSLGVLLYELLTGVTPFDREAFAKAGLLGIRRLILETEPPKPSTRLQTLGEKITEVAKRRQAAPAELSRLVRGDLDWIVMKCLEKDRARRYDTTGSLVRDVIAFLEQEPVSAAAPTVSYRLAKFARRNRMALAGLTTVMLLLLAGAGTTLWQAMRANQEAKRRGDQLERSLYKSSLALAQRALADHKTDALMTALENCPPRLRGWEWRYLQGQTDFKFDSFGSYTNPLVALASSTDGRFMATLNDTGRLQLWDATLRIAKWEKVVGTNPPACLAFVADNRKLMLAEGIKDSARSSNTGAGFRGDMIWLRVWDTTDGQAAEELNLPGTGFLDVAISPSGNYLAIAEGDGQASIWDLKSRQAVHRIRATSNWIWRVVFSPNDKWFATLWHSRDPRVFVHGKTSGRAAGRVQIHEVKTGAAHAVIGDILCPMAAAFSPDDKLLAVGCLTSRHDLGFNESTVSLFDLGGYERKSWREPNCYVDTLIFGGDGSTLTAVARKGWWRVEVCQWDPVSGEEVSKVRISEGSARALVVGFSGSKTQFALANCEIENSARKVPAGQVAICSPPASSENVQLPQGFGFRALDPNGRFAVSQQTTGSFATNMITTTFLVGLSNAAVLRQSSHPEERSTGSSQLTFAGGKLLELRENPSRIEIWDTATARIERTITGNEMFGRPLTFTASPRGDLLALETSYLMAGKEERRLLIYETTTGRRLLDEKNQRLFACFLPDGRVMLQANGTNAYSKVLTVATPSGTHLLNLDHVEANDAKCAVSPSGRFLAVAVPDGMLNRVSLYETSNWRLLGSRELESGWVTDVTFSQDDRRLAVVIGNPNERRSAIHLLDAEFANHLLALDSTGDNQVSGVVFSPDGESLHGSQFGGSRIKVWRAPAANSTAP